MHLSENITLIGYHSKRQSYLFLAVAIVIAVTAVLCYFFAEGEKKYAAFMLMLIAIGFFAGFINLLKQPKLMLKVVDDRFLYCYSNRKEKKIDLYEVSQIHYWRANLGLKMSIVTLEGRIHLTCLLKDASNVKQQLLSIFRKNNIEIINRYDD